MRLLAVFACLAALTASAKCRTNGVFVFPSPGAVIPTNAKFILEGAGSEQSRVEKLIGAGELVLASKAGNISVRAEKGWVSSMKRVAVRLVPTTPLAPNAQYSLMIEKLLPGYKVLNEGGADTLTWTTAAVEDTTPPKYLVKPTIAEGSHSTDSDGVSRTLKLRTTLEEESPAYVVVQLKRARGSAVVQVYPLVLNGGEAMLGHDACSGSFSWDDGRAYKISVETYDSAGNKAAEKLGVIEASAPRQDVE